jgi:hypothetical protein
MNGHLGAVCGVPRGSWAEIEVRGGSDAAPVVFELVVGGVFT